MATVYIDMSEITHVPDSSDLLRENWSKQYFRISLYLVYIPNKDIDQASDFVIGWSVGVWCRGLTTYRCISVQFWEVSS